MKSMSQFLYKRNKTLIASQIIDLISKSSATFSTFLSFIHFKLSMFYHGKFKSKNKTNIIKNIITVIELTDKGVVFFN